MRITDRMIVNNTLSQLQQSRERLGEAQTQIATGRRVRRVSDAPADAERAMAVVREKHMNENHISNLAMSRDWMGATEHALSDFNDLLLETRTMALRAVSDTFDENERAAMAQQIGTIIDNAVSLGNTQHAGNYVFAGHQVKTAPFALQDGSILYQGDDGAINHLVEADQTMTVNITGTEGENGGLQGLLTGLVALQTALETDDSAGVQGYLDDSEAVTKDIYRAISNTGSRMQRVDRTVTRLETRQLDLTQIFSKLVDTDLPATITEMNAEERAYEMSLNAAGRIMPRSLLDFLR